MSRQKIKNLFPKLLMLLALSLAFSFILLPDPVHAQSNVEYRLETGIPGSSEFERGEDVTFSGDTLGKYIRAIYNYSLGIVGILAAVVLMIGGVIWLTAGGNVNRVETAKQWIGGALIGLVLMLTSYMLLYQINPELVAFPELEIDQVDLGEISLDSDFGCCQFDDTAEFRSREICESDEYAGGPGTFYGPDYEPVGDTCVNIPTGCCLYDLTLGTYDSCENTNRLECDLKPDLSNTNQFNEDESCVEDNIVGWTCN